MLGTLRARLSTLQPSLSNAIPTLGTMAPPGRTMRRLIPTPHRSLSGPLVLVHPPVGPRCMTAGGPVPRGDGAHGARLGAASSGGDGCPAPVSLQVNGMTGVPPGEARYRLRPWWGYAVSWRYLRGALSSASVLFSGFRSMGRSTTSAVRLCRRLRRQRVGRRSRVARPSRKRLPAFDRGPEARHVCDARRPARRVGLRCRGRDVLR
jgi:hypothetical protein